MFILKFFYCTGKHCSLIRSCIMESSLCSESGKCSIDRLILDTAAGYLIKKFNKSSHSCTPFFWLIVLCDSNAGAIRQCTQYTIHCISRISHFSWDCFFFSGPPVSLGQGTKYPLVLSIDRSGLWFLNWNEILEEKYRKTLHFLPLVL